MIKDASEATILNYFKSLQLFSLKHTISHYLTSSFLKALETTDDESHQYTSKWSKNIKKLVK